MRAMLAELPAVRDLDADQLRVAAALRFWALTRRLGRSFVPVMAERLGNAHAAAHLHMLLEEIGAAWPEPFCVSPPCSPRLSHDEATLAEMIALAGREDRPAFDRLLADLLPHDERERLFVWTTALTRCLRAPESRRPGIDHAADMEKDDGRL